MSSVGFFFFSSRRRHTRYGRDWSSDVCSSDLLGNDVEELRKLPQVGDGEGLCRFHRKRATVSRSVLLHPPVDVVIPRESGYPVSRGARAELRGRGVLDHPLSRMMTAQPTAMALPSFAPS